MNIDNQTIKCIHCGSVIESRSKAELCPRCRLPLPKRENKKEKQTKSQIFDSITEVTEDNSNRNLALILSVSIGIIGVIVMVALGIRGGLVGLIPALAIFAVYKAIRSKN